MGKNPKTVPAEISPQSLTIQAFSPTPGMSTNMGRTVREGAAQTPPGMVPGPQPHTPPGKRGTSPSGTGQRRVLA